MQNNSFFEELETIHREVGNLRERLEQLVRDTPNPGNTGAAIGDKNLPFAEKVYGHAQKTPQYRHPSTDMEAFGVSLDGAKKCGQLTTEIRYLGALVNALRRGLGAKAVKESLRYYNFLNTFIREGDQRAREIRRDLAFRFARPPAKTAPAPDAQE